MLMYPCAMTVVTWFSLVMEHATKEEPSEIKVWQDSQDGSLYHVEWGGVSA